MTIAREFLKREDCLLLLVDIQKVLFEPCVMKEEMLKSWNALIDICNILEIPIILTTHNAEKLGGFMPELLEKVEKPVVLNKLEFSCFQNDSIRQAVESTGKKSIILAGMESHVCIFHTGAHAIRLGYRVDLVTDGVTSRSESNREIGIKRLEQAGAVMSSAEMVIFELLNRAGTEEFRKALPLLKTL